MKYKSFTNMTKVSPPRKFNNFTNKLKSWIFFMRVKLYSLFSKSGILVKHLVIDNKIDQGTIPKSMPNLKSDRYDFVVSYVIDEIRHTNEYWFENKRGERLFVISDEHFTELVIKYRAELVGFVIHLSHKQSERVTNKCPRYCIVPKTSISVTDKNNGNLSNDLEVKQGTCDFSKCRYAFNFSVHRDDMHTTHEEVISESYKVFKDKLASKVAEINKTLTGVDNDGAMTSPKNQPLADNCICPECGYPLFMSSKGTYKFECIHHGDIDSFQRVDPQKYVDIFKYCEFELEQFCYAR